MKKFIWTLACFVMISNDYAPAQTVDLIAQQSIANAMLATKTPIVVTVGSGANAYTLRIQELIYDHGVNGQDAVCLALAYASRSGNTGWALRPKDTTLTSSGVVAAVQKRVPGFGWVLAMRVVLHWDGSHIDMTVQPSSVAVGSSLTDQGAPPHAVLKRLQAKPGIVLPNMTLTPILLKFPTDKSLSLDVIPSFRKDSFILTGAIAPQKAPNGADLVWDADERSTLFASDEFINVISSAAVGNQGASLDVGDGTKVSVNDIRVSMTGSAMVVTAEMGPSTPGCEVRVSTRWVGEDLRLDDIQLLQTPSMQEPKCAADKRKWSLISNALAGSLHGTLLRPTALRRIHTSIGGVGADIAIEVERAWVSGSSAYIQARLWLVRGANEQ